LPCSLKWSSTGTLCAVKVSNRFLMMSMLSSERPLVRGLHSSTVQLNFSAFCVTGGAIRGCSGGVLGVAGGFRDV